MNSVNFFQTTPRIVMGPGSFKRIAEEAGGWAEKR